MKNWPYLVLHISSTGTDFPPEPKPRARVHPKREASLAKHHQQLVRPAHRLPHLRVASDDVVCRHKYASNERHWRTNQFACHQVNYHSVLEEVFVI